MKNYKRRCPLILLFALLLSFVVAPTAQANAAQDIVSVANGERWNNDSKKYCKWFYEEDRLEAWCAIFVSWCANEAGIPTSVIPKTAGVGTMYSGVLKGGGTITTSPQAGDLIFYWRKDASPARWAHVGIMTGSKTSVQGNTAGKVYEVEKPTDYCLPQKSKNYDITYVRPNYGVGCTTRPNVSISGHNVVVSWTAVKSATHYDVYLMDINKKDIKYQGTEYGTTHTFDNVASGKYFAYVIARPNDNDKQSPWTNSFTVPTSEVASISLNTDSMVINENSCVPLTANTMPIGKTVTWYSSNPSVATVDPSGTVTTVTGIKAGSATITASIDTDTACLSATCKVVVMSATQNPISLPVSGASSITQTTARVDASCSYEGTPPKEVGLLLGKAEDEDKMIKWGSDIINYRKNPFDIWYNLSGLTKNTTYYYKFYAIIDEQPPYYSDICTFRTTDEPTQIGVVTDTNGQYLAINSKPASGNQIGRIPPGGKVTVDTSRTSGNWYYVTYNGVSGYAYKKYITLQ